MSLARNVFVQSGLTLASRVLGFVRDLALNARFGGQGPLMDAWATAQMLQGYPVGCMYQERKRSTYHGSVLVALMFNGR